MTSQVPAPTPVQKKIATYYVVPVVPDPTSTETVLYYQDGQPDEPIWVLANPKDLNARAQGCDANKVKLIQKSQHETQCNTRLPSSKLDATVELYAGVAKTLGAPDKLHSVYAATDGSLIIDVAANSTRGVILVFTQTQTAANGGTPPYPVARLIATTDPEIKNSTGGNIPD